MAIAHSATIRNTFANTVLTAIDAGAGAGKIVLRAGTTVIGEIPLNDPAGTITGAVLTLDVDPVPEDVAADATGVVDNFQIRDSDNNVIFSGSVTVTGGGGDGTMGSTNVTTGDPLRLTGLTYTAVA